MFAIQKHKNGNGMILWNWLASSTKKGGGLRNCQIKLELIAASIIQKLGKDTGGLRDCKIGVFAFLEQWGIYVYWAPKETLQSILLFYFFIKCDYMAFLHIVKVVHDVFEDKCHTRVSQK